MKSIAVLGLGKVGRLAAQLLVDSDFTVIGVDSAANPKDCLLYTSPSPRDRG